MRIKIIFIVNISKSIKIKKISILYKLATI